MSGVSGQILSPLIGQQPAQALSTGDPGPSPISSTPPPQPNQQLTQALMQQSQQAPQSPIAPPIDINALIQLLSQLQGGGGGF